LSRSADDPLAYPKHSDFHTKANIGYDFMRSSKWLVQAPPEKFNQVFASYARNLLGVIVASCAIEGYVHYVGYHRDHNWAKFTKRPKSLKKRIKRIYRRLEKEVDIKSGVMEQVLNLADMRNMLVHPPFQEVKKKRPTPTNPIFERVDAEFPAAKSRQIAENFRDKILRDSGLRDL
jgi:hypothetical protein